jgi:phosphopantetheinyl transferase
LSVDVWVVKVTDEGPLGLRAAHSLLGTHLALDRLAIDDQRRSVVARAALTRLVANRTGADPARVQLDHDARGRPLLSDSALHLSIAHSGEYVACAVSGRRVGVDIERSDRAEADDEFARRVCSPAELEQLGELTAPALIRLWTRKEAVAKLLGFGLTLPFEQLDVSRDRPRIAGHEASGLRVRDLVGGPDDYAVAIATDGRWRPVRARLVAEHWESPMQSPSRLLGWSRVRPTRVRSAHSPATARGERTGDATG